MPHITVVGSYATGLTMKVPRLPSTGETLLGTGYRVDYGGKGSNQAVGCARLGALVHFVARIGDDSFGDMAIKLHQSEGVGIQHMRRTPRAPTGVGFIIVEQDSGNNCIVIDPGANDCLTAADVLAAEGAFADSAVVLTQLEISSEAAEAALRCGRDHGSMTILNPAPVRPLPDSVFELVDVLTPNTTEARVLAGLSPEATAEPEEVACRLLQKGVKQVVMTLGENGAMIVSSSSTLKIPAIRVNAIDTTGAGDAFNAGLATALASGASLQDAVQFAVVCGGLAVTKDGVIPSLPHRNDVCDAYRTQKLTVPSWIDELGSPEQNLAAGEIS